MHKKEWSGLVFSPVIQHAQALQINIEARNIYEATGFELPFDHTSLIDKKCHRCLKSGDYQDGDNAAVRELCTNVYPSLEEYENRISNLIQYPNDSGCDRMNGTGGASVAPIEPVAPIQINGWRHPRALSRHCQISTCYCCLCNYDCVNLIFYKVRRNL